MNTYKFRAECIHDVLKIMESTPLIVEISSCSIEGSPIPDCVVVARTELSLKVLKNLIATIPDTHVILETIENESKYTGERKQS